MRNYYVPGAWNIICDVCGFKFKNTMVRKRWDGLMVCSEDFELDHPQKFLRVHEDGQAVPVVRDEPPPVFHYVCYIYASGGFADLGESDCAQADKSTPSYSSLLALKNASLG